MKTRSLFLVLTLLTALSASASQWRQAPSDFSTLDTTEEAIEQAYSTRDFKGLEAIEEYNRKHGTSLRPWEGLYDFDQPEKQGDALEPWLNEHFEYRGEHFHKLDISTQKGALVFAQIMQEYVYQGWFTAKNKDNSDEHFRQNDQRTWCSTPWMVDGQKGREAVHGLTKEFPMHTNPIYPEDKNFVETGDKGQQPSSWGTAYFNKPVCDLYSELFGSRENPLFPPNFQIHEQGKDNPDGFVSFKMLFNTLETWKDYGPLQGAYHWKAHVSNTHYSPERKIQEIPHIQMDISIKDSRLSGTKEEVDYWVMITYVYDKNYYDGQMQVENLPDSLRHMRPVGVQFGFEPQESLIFEGAQTNYRENDEVISFGDRALLNGPADNPYSSCLGCHGAAGLETELSTELQSRSAEYSQHSFVWQFTFFKTEDYLSVTDKYGKGFQFNRQVDNAYKRVQLWLNKL